VGACERDANARLLDLKGLLANRYRHDPDVGVMSTGLVDLMGDRGCNAQNRLDNSEHVCDYLMRLYYAERIG
jgi:hypothetical protein